MANIARATTLLAQGPAVVEADDGQLSVTVVATHGLLDAVATAAHLRRERAFSHADRENARSLSRSRGARRDRAGALDGVMVDGEDACDAPITVRSVPGSLRVLVPAPTNT